MSFGRKIRVLVVDDSAVVRRMITDALKCDLEIDVVGTAADPYAARDQIMALNPDVLTLDIEMPRMDGLSFLKILQQHHPIPVLVISSLTQRGSTLAMEALNAGAVDVLAKPSSSDNGHLAAQLRFRVRAVAAARRQAATPATTRPTCLAPTTFSPRQLILIGGSTGGTVAIKEILSAFPAQAPGICIVQHIPARLSRTFAESLNNCCSLEVREAAHDDLVAPGTALVAPGDFHMTVQWTLSGYRVALNQRPAVHYCRPAVDVLFQSALKAGPDVVAVLLTGMGTDGAIGMKHLRDAGAHTIAQDEATSAVYGMPRAAVQLGGAIEEKPLPNIAPAICSAVNARGRSTGARLERPVA
jgi:two-component system, chemotaxis family, protein-glutamate methylesterase/glutaminase